MARTQLIRTDSLPYHVTIRSNNREWFNLPMERVWDICTHSLKKASQRCPVEIDSFVLMSNHYHMLVYTPDANLDKFMFFFNKEISRCMRKQTGRVNRIFGDRYKWCIVNRLNHFQNVKRYIYQNPVRANLVKRCEDYPYSSLFYKARGVPFSVSLSDSKVEKQELEYFNETFDNQKSREIKKSLKRMGYFDP